MRIAICAKSRWEPASRREHAFALTAARKGVDVVFVESPHDVRGVTAPGASRWIRSLTSTDRRAATRRISVMERSTAAPGHRGRGPARLDCLLLAGQLRSLHREAPLDAVVVQMPWQWPAVSDLPVRRVFDAADDWTAMIPQRSGWIGRCYDDVSADADMVVLSAGGLMRLFPGARTTVVPNGVDVGLCDGAPTAPPRRKRLGYLGTLSERFDAFFVTDLMTRLPDWSLDLYGPSQYAGAGDRAGAELQALLDRHPDRVRWHGPAARSEVTRVLDAADVLLIPNRRDRSGGQSSMKTFEYAARGRPVVSTVWDDDLRDRVAPGTALVSSVAEAAAAVRAGESEAESLGRARVEWAREQSWESRWADWAGAVLGVGTLRLDAPRPPVAVTP